jgi:predicted PurR-regulated permease PerM
MQRAVGLNPIVVILGIGIGANLLGIMGALLIVPFISFVIVLYNGIMKSKNQGEND